MPILESNRAARGSSERKATSGSRHMRSTKARAAGAQHDRVLRQLGLPECLGELALRKANKASLHEVSTDNESLRLSLWGPLR